MALVSPGIQVTVTDQSNYVPSANGTVPYILLATAQDKPAPGGGVASGTLAENAGKLYAITSQRDLVNTFGTPTFQKTASGTPINGSELNEYGLLAAYSALGASNQVFIQRADIDLNSLDGSTSRPSGDPANGQYWLNTSTTTPGIFAWNATTQSFNEVPVQFDKSDSSTSAPSNMVGAPGEYLIKAAAVPMTGWFKRWDNTWVKIGSADWQKAIPAITGNKVVTSSDAGSININGVPVNISLGSNAEIICNTIESAQITGVYARPVAGAVTIAVTSAADDGAGTVNISGNVEIIGVADGTYYSAAVAHAPYYNQPKWTSVTGDIPRPTNSLWVKTSQVGGGTNFALNQYSSATGQWSSVNTSNYYSNGEATYYTDPINGGLNIPTGTVWAEYNASGTAVTNEVISWDLWYRKNAGATVTTGLTIATNSVNSSNFTLEVTQPGKVGYDNSYQQDLTFAANTAPETFVSRISGISPYVRAELVDNKVVLTHTRGGDIRFGNVTGDILEAMGLTYNEVGGAVYAASNFYRSYRDNGTSFISSNWAPLKDLDYWVASSQPSAVPDNGALWYWNVPTHVDIMVNDGTAWVGYRTLSQDIRNFDLTVTDPNGVQVRTTAPTTKSDGSVLTNGDLWIDSSDLENFPKLYRYRESGKQWALIDNTDGISQNGIVFADARWSTSANVDPAFGAIPSQRELALSSYVDLDAPNPALYPRGILLFNTRASSYNVKKYVENYFTEEAYPDADLTNVAPDAWVSVSGNKIGTSMPAFGRGAQRNVVVSAMKAAIDASSAIREEQNAFNLIACPGYPELILNMVALNNDRNNTAFIIGDTPMRLAANGTDIIGWAQNSQNQTQTNEAGLVSHDPYLAVYYPSGLANDLTGSAVVVPPSHAMIRTIIRSDNASYPWFPAAGTRRGLLDNVSAVGYIDSASGAFVSIGVTQGLRDTLYSNNINPLTYLQGAGLVCYGNKTTASTPSALDRINVARLINYIRQQLDRLARPYIFEPNDPITRNQIKVVTESLLNDVVAKRGITDFLVVCDTSNNTPDRIARNELYVDVAIQPTKDVEFIYIPIRLKNPGELESGNVASTLTAGTGA